MRHASVPAVAVLLALIEVSGQEAVFKSGVDIVQVAATVTDGDGRFISGLTRNDFVVYEDGRPQEIVAFSSERVPVSLGMLLDVSGSMTEDRMATARLAINHFAYTLLAAQDALFLMEFGATGRILQTWTSDRAAFSRALERANRTPLVPVQRGRFTDDQPGNIGTSLFDAVATSLDLAVAGPHQKKVVLILSDGKDTTSRRSVGEVRDAIRKSEILVYALAVDGGSLPGPFGDVDGGVDAGALRKLTDDTGGRTEVVKGFENLAEATARLADEFNRQYLIGYAAPSRDGRRHTIKVDVRKRGAKVRARTGYTAS